MSSWRGWQDYEKLRRSAVQKCPWCDLSNWWEGAYRDDNGREQSGRHWDGPFSAIRAGTQANLWTKRGRIYGGPRRKRGLYSDAMGPVRVNERRWKVVRSGIRLLVACANPFHEDRSQ